MDANLQALLEAEFSPIERIALLAAINTCNCVTCTMLRLYLERKKRASAEEKKT